MSSPSSQPDHLLLSCRRNGGTIITGATTIITGATTVGDRVMISYSLWSMKPLCYLPTRREDDLHSSPPFCFYTFQVSRRRLQVRRTWRLCSCSALFSWQRASTVLASPSLLDRKRQGDYHHPFNILTQDSWLKTPNSGTKLLKLWTN